MGASEYLPFNVWAIEFLKAQGYDIDTNVLYQDNQGAMLMERNGRNSCTGNSRHINIRYFFIKDRVDKGEVKIEYCPTYLMLADYFTKPLQGRMFKLFRDVIMGYRPLEDLLLEIPKKERVGNVSNSYKTEKVFEISRNKQKSKSVARLTNDAEIDKKISKEVKWKDVVINQKGTQISN